MLNRLAFAILLTGAALSLSGCFLKGGSADTELRDDLVKEAKQQYDDGSYRAAYIYAGKALDKDPSDLGARMIQGWALLQIGDFDDFKQRDTGMDTPGARNIFKEILAKSPNEFRARQGLATIGLREYFTLTRRARKFDEAARALDDIAAKCRRLAAGSGLSLEQREVLADEAQAAWIRYSSAFKLYREGHPAAFYEQDRPKAHIGPKPESEDFAMKAFDYDFRRYSMDKAADTAASLAVSQRLRVDYWQNAALEKLDDARAGFLDLESTAPGYFQVKRDLAFVHAVQANIALEKSLAVLNDGRREDGKSPTAGGVPDGRVRRTDENFEWKSLPEKWRELVRREAANSARYMEAYIAADEEDELKGQQKVADVQDQFWTGKDNQDALVYDVLERYQNVVAEIVRDRRSQRKLLILQLLVYYTYPLYGVQDLDKAEHWAGRLYDTDSSDPIVSFIYGVIAEKDKRYRDAIEQYRSYLSRSSVTTDYNRRVYANDRIAACEKLAKGN